MGLKLGWIGLSHHDVQLDRVLGAIEDDLRPYGRGLKSTSLVVLEVLMVAAFKVALQAFGVGLYPV